jgi:hypothetical protein
LTTPSGEWQFRLAVAAQACPDADTVPQSCARPQPVDRGPAKEERQVPDSVKPRLCGHSHHTNDERHRNAQHQIHLYPTEKSLLLALPPATRGSFWIRHLIIRRLPIVDNLLRLSCSKMRSKLLGRNMCIGGSKSPPASHIIPSFLDTSPAVLGRLRSPNFLALHDLRLLSRTARQDSEFALSSGRDLFLVLFRFFHSFHVGNCEQTFWEQGPELI